MGTPDSQLRGAAIDEQDQSQKDLQLDTKDQSLPERSTAEDTGGATMSQVVTRGQHTLTFKQESGSRLDLQIKENLEQGCLLALSELEGFYWLSLFY